MRPPRVEGAAATVAIDGRLDEPVWAQAARLTGFSRYAPTDGAPADDSTEVLVWYSPSAIHFGIRAYAQPGTVRATLADRDKMFQDDYVGIFLGTFNDGRQATVFAVNPLGVQGDGIMVETGSRGAGFGGLAVGREPTDVSPDYVFQSKGRLTDFGYEIEIRIPFKSVTYQSADPQTWSINVLRVVQSRGLEYSWAPAARNAPSYIAQHGHLVGLTGLSRGLVLDVSPVVTTHVDGAPAPGGYHYDADRPKFGVNARWGVTNNLTLSGTLNPDFAEVESDAGQISSDPRAALFFAEKRPFFLEGLEQFATPSNLVYTRRILSPVAAAKMTGKIAGTSVALLTAVDDTLSSVSGHDRPLFNILRVRRDIGTGSRLGVIVTDKEEGTSSNRVAGSDLRLVLGEHLSAQLQAVLSRTEQPGTPTITGPLWGASLSRAGRTFNAQYQLSGISDDFRTAAGFIGRPAIAHARADHSVTLYGPKSSALDNATFDLAYDLTWQYDPFIHQGDAIEKKLHFNNNYFFRGGWHIGASVLAETFGFDRNFYANYAIERHRGLVVDTVPFTGTPRIPNLDYVILLDTPQFQHFSFSGTFVWGRDENFYEWATADIGYYSLSANWRPNEQLRVEGTFNWQYYYRRTDGSQVADARIPRVKVEYQLTRAIFFRLVGQYTANVQSDLRDDTRTGDPLLIRNGAGVYERAVASSDNQFQVDGLFSYTPSPGTVIYAGYGSTLAEPGAFRFQQLDRTRDGFFLKASYLFRL